MSEGVPHGAVGRLLSDLTIGVQQAVRTKDAREAKNGLRELELQFQIKVVGIVGSGAIDFNHGSTITLQFPFPFYYAPAQRESNLEYPHLSIGTHVSPAVVLHVVVTEWLHNEQNGSINGAHLAMCVQGEEGIAFEGWVHAKFQGYSALLDDESVGVNG